jgi:BON domain
MARTISPTILGAGVGAGLMFLMDPARGPRRRALVRDKFTRLAHKTRDAYGATQRDLGNRLGGVASEVQSRIQGGVADDRIIEARVRAELGRVCSHPRAIRVNATNGWVTMSGDVLASEAGLVETAIRKVRGVGGVNRQFTVHATGNGVPSLQGTSPRSAWWSSWAAESWSPTAKTMVGLGAVASLAAAAALRRT